MKSIYAYAVCSFMAPTFFAGICRAQTIELKPAPAGIVIDGDAKEWGDPLSYTDTKTKLNYTLTNDKDNLYLILKTKDLVQQANILGGGLSIGIDPKGKKKPSFVCTFPASDASSGMMFNNLTAAKAQVGIQSSKFKKIQVEGFKDITDEQLSLGNPQGIQTAITYDASGTMIYEAAIPLALYHAADMMGKEWSFIIKLNALERKEKSGAKSNGAFQGASGAHGGVGNVGFGSGSIQKIDPEAAERVVTLAPAIDFGGKFTLAKAQ